MPHPLAICLEDLDAGSPGERYLRCVALPGRQPGLRVDRAGVVLWRSDEAMACELWVSQDEKLILYRPAGGAPVTVRRVGRTLEVPFGKPVVLIDQDEVVAGMRRLRVHVHGVATTVAEPSPLPVPEKAARGGLRSAAAAVALGAALGGAALFQVRCHPPEPSPVPPLPEDRDAGAPPPDDAGAQQDIEVRVVPPEAPPEVEPPAPPPPPPEQIEVRETPPIAPFPDSVPGGKPSGEPKPE
jgi:hypothetical protein